MSYQSVVLAAGAVFVAKLDERRLAQMIGLHPDRLGVDGEDQVDDPSMMSGG
jgi:cell division ATPase FtsA